VKRRYERYYCTTTVAPQRTKAKRPPVRSRPVARYAAGDAATGSDVRQAAILLSWLQYYTSY